MLHVVFSKVPVELFQALTGTKTETMALVVSLELVFALADFFFADRIYIGCHSAAYLKNLFYFTRKLGRIDKGKAKIPLGLKLKKNLDDVNGIGEYPGTILA